MIKKILPNKILDSAGQSYLNLKNDELDRPIYRILSFDQLIDLFNTNNFVLSHPTKWDDPFETHVMGAKFRSGNTTSSRALNKVIFGSCWTTRSVSDALWRIYSPSKNSVRIRTTPRTLGTAIAKSIEHLERSKWYIGKVEYLPQSKIVDQATRLATEMMKDNSESSAARSLLFKRNSFSHESEIRAIVIDRHARAKSGLLRLKINPHEVIESILVDSRASDALMGVYKNHLKSILGFKGVVSKSTLYDPPKGLIVEIEK